MSDRKTASSPFRRRQIKLTVHSQSKAQGNSRQSREARLNHQLNSTAPSTRDFPGFCRHTMEIANLTATKNAVAQQGTTLERPSMRGHQPSKSER